MTDPIKPQSPQPAPRPAPTKAPEAVTKPKAAIAPDQPLAAGTAMARPANLSPDQLANLATKKATCPFMAAAVAQGDLAVRNSADKPLASIDDVAALGNTGGGNLGEVLRVFAQGNHGRMRGAGDALDQPVPAGLYSLDFPGSQGSHPGHSGILQGDPLKLDTGRFSQADLDRLLARAQGGMLKRSDFGAFIAENLARDPNAKVASAKVAGLLLKDIAVAGGRSVPALVEKVKNAVRGGPEPTDKHRRLLNALTKTAGEENLVGSAGEYGLLLAFLAHSPRSKQVDGEPAVAVADVEAMFKHHRFPDGWETWPKTATDWVANTTALTASAGKAYHRLKQ